MAQKAAKSPRRLNVAAIIGIIAVIGGIGLAIVGGIVSMDNSAIILTLVILGILVGLLNVTAKEVVPFMVAAIALVVVGQLGFTALDDIWSGLGTHLTAIVKYFAQFMAPAAVISALRALVQLGFPGD